MDNSRVVLDEMEVMMFNNDDINIVKDVCYLATDRSAKLVAISKLKACSNICKAYFVGKTTF